jgi:hypothetical protein
MNMDKNYRNQVEVLGLNEKENEALLNERALITAVCSANNTHITVVCIVQSVVKK